MITTRNAFTVKTAWGDVIRWASAQVGVTHITVFTLDTDVVGQFLSEPNSAAFIEDETEQVLFRRGFNGRDLPPFYAVRFKIWDQTAFPMSTTKIDVTLHD